MEEQRGALEALPKFRCFKCWNPFWLAPTESDTWGQTLYCPFCGTKTVGPPPEDLQPGVIPTSSRPRNRPRAAISTSGVGVCLDVVSSFFFGFA